jgi:hypothetical protein
MSSDDGLDYDVVDPFLELLHIVSHLGYSFEGGRQGPLVPFVAIYLLSALPYKD